MERSTKDAWLTGPSDLREAEVMDVPVPGQSVRVRGLAAAYSNQATSEALELVQGPRGEQSAHINTEKLEILQFAHGCIEPTFTVDEARTIAQRMGPSFKKIIAKIDELSGVDKETIEQVAATFPSGGRDEAGSDVVNGAAARTG